ncbi:iron ABC transporter permease [Tessaracoccus sp. MC1627]|uniref:FecCD family ABC transporter permease n=1 Tax=Tessaracoccus sp. MC1627 TaxID=2760312 RepID=UPI001C72163F
MTLTRAAGGLIAVGCLAVGVMASFALGSVRVPVGDVVAFLTGGDPATATILAARVDRTLVGVVCGAALALSGAILQGVTRNPLADPGLLGINAGAALAVALGVVTGVGASQGTVVGLSLLGAGAAAVFVALLSRGRNDPVLLVLLGAAVTAACLSAVSAVTIRNQAALEVMRFWQVGSIGGRGLPLLLPSLPVLLAGAGLTVWAGSTLNTLAVGDELATALGTRLGRTRAVLTTGAVLLAAGSVAVVGPIGFVGLVVPHVVRLLMGPDYRVVIAGSLVLGPVLLLTADIIGRMVMPPAEISAGLVVLLLGAPVLVALVRRSVHA